MERRNSRARWAWAMSLALHASALLMLHLFRSEAPVAIAGMEVGTIHFDAEAPANVTLSSLPQPLPAVTALPLDTAPEPSNFEAVVQAAAIQAANPVGQSPQAEPAAPRRDLPPGVATIFFGVPATASSVVYVIDRSASMGLEQRLSRAVGEAAMSVAQLPATARVQVIAYSRTPEPLGPGLVAVGPDVVRMTTDRLLQLRAEGGTDHVRALRSALALNPEVVYFLTDEDDLTPADVKAVTDYNRGRTVIHTICMVDPGTRQSPLAELAKRNRGQFRVAK